MKEPNRYGEVWAEVYDAYTEGLDLDPSAAVAFLEAAAGSGPVLELGIGTGRLGLPLAARGVSVHGIEASDRMISHLRSKPGGDALKIYKADYSSFSLDEEYTLIFAAFNGVGMLPEREDQLNCFRSVAAALAQGGKFVIEADIPDLNGFVDNMRINAVGGNEESLELQITRHRPVQQQLLAYHIWLGAEGIRMRTVRMRYMNLSEYDFMAEAGGLKLHARVSDWSGRPLTQRSRRHISTYIKP